MAVIELTDINFNKEVLEAEMPVLVDFWASWCSPCQMAAPVIEELAKEYEGKVKFGKVNVDKNPPTAAKYGVMSIPTVIMFENGKEAKKLVGFLGKASYQQLIEEVIKKK